MTPNEYQEQAMRTKCSMGEAAQRLLTADVTTIQLLHSFIGMVGEVGELACAIEKWMFYGQELDLTNIQEELGDHQWYNAEACDALGTTVESVMQSNIAKLKKRYPEKFDTELAKEENRDREAEATALSPRDMTDDEFETFTLGVMRDKAVEAETFVFGGPQHPGSVDTVGKALEAMEQSQAGCTNLPEEVEDPKRDSGVFNTRKCVFCNHRIGSGFFRNFTAEICRNCMRGRGLTFA